MNDGVIYLHIHTDFRVLNMQAISNLVYHGNKRYVQFTSSTAMLNVRYELEPELFETAESAVETLSFLKDKAYVAFRMGH